MVGSEDIFDFRKLTLAPIVVLLGFVLGIFAIMRKSKA
jgi:F0F1-type ATP synthase assembly protein I